MKLRYYLRGLGIGIIVTLILTGIAGNKKQEMTNEEIKARAAELGMIESTTLSGESTPEPTQTPDPTPEATDTPSPTLEPTQTPSPTPKPTNTPSPTPTAMPTPVQESADEEGTVTIIVKRGDSSGSVSRMVQEAGLVENAQEFDRYLCENGYDKKISVGYHEIPLGASYEEIAKILTGR